jgi:hypothetical protein
MGDPYPHGYGYGRMGVNPYPPLYMDDPVGLFLCRGYEYGIVILIPGGYLPIAISRHDLAREGVLHVFGGACRVPD